MNTTTTIQRESS